MYFVVGSEALAMQHGMAGEETWTPSPSMLICLQHGPFAALSHAPKIKDWHASADVGSKPTRPRHSAKITSARIE